MGKIIVLPFLYFSHVGRVDKLVISHGDNDHIGGAYALINSLLVSEVLSSVPERFPLALSHGCEAGQHWRWDGVDFAILSPFLDKHFSGNDASCVLRISNGAHSILLTGDIEKKAERVLVKRMSYRLASDILVAPHHGSRTSSTLSFIQAVKPSYVLFPTGFLNRFHFPSKIVIQRYQKVHARLFNTADCGTVLFKLTTVKKPPDVVCYRYQHRHYWDVD